MSVTLYFLEKKSDDFFYFQFTFFGCRLLSTPIFPRRFQWSHVVVYPVCFVNSATKIILGRVSSPGGCHPGAIRPCPSSDATGYEGGSASAGDGTASDADL